MRKVIVSAGMSALLLSACFEEPQKPPLVGSVTYDKQVTMDFQELDKTRNVNIEGKRCYWDANATYQEHEFRFQKGDSVHVVLVDYAGVRPGENWSYRLYFKEGLTGSIKKGAAFVLETSVSGTSTKPVGRFEYDLVVDGGVGGNSIPAGTLLGGLYQLGQTDRSLSIDLAFKLSTAVGYSKICTDYD